MIIGIHPDHNGTESYSDHWAEFLQQRGVQVRWLDLLAPDALNQIQGCDGVMWRWIHFPAQKQTAHILLFMIEQELGIPVFPNQKTTWHFDNKAAQAYLLKHLGAPVPQTWVFWQETDALTWAQTAPYPVIFKLTSGAGSSNVIKVQNKRQAEKLIRRMFHHGIFPSTMNEYRRGGMPRSLRQFLLMGKRALQSPAYVFNAQYPQLDSVFWQPEAAYAYFQEFLPGNEYDTRVNIIGNRAFAFRRLNRPDDFRASGSGRLLYTPAEVDSRCIEIAFTLSRNSGFQSMAYDFLYQGGLPVVNEISYTFVNKAVYDSPGHWDEQLNWHEGHMWPEEAQVEVFLQELQKPLEG